jgi:alpha-1,3-mannosyltransferase
MPNWVILLLCISKRVHSIYMLRLFNDGIAMLIFYISVILLIEGRLWLANIGLRCVY